ncbi:MAG: Gfo/Idh/MocA family protein [Propionibacteriaceae bacterium]
MKIGLMSFAHVHAAAYAALLAGQPGVELRASDPDHHQRPAGESGGAELARELGVDYLDSYPALLDWGPDAVIVCAENARHRPLVEQAAAVGAHVLCEKPIATTLEDAAAMITACEQAGVALMMAYPVHFSAAYAELRSVVDSGRLGTVLAAVGSNNGRIPLTSRGWFVDPELAGGGALVDHTVHLAELLDDLLGHRPPVSVYATTNQVLHAGDVAIETGGLLSLEYADTPLGDRVTATLDCSWSKPDSYPTWGGLALQLIGTAGIAEMDAFNQRVDGHSERDGNGLWLPYGGNPDAALLAEFTACVQTGRVPQPDGRVGYRTLQVVEAAQRSVVSGQPTTVREVLAVG